jgi:multidrug efflux pump subunit AcrA (membrane-fusion protein)
MTPTREAFEALLDAMLDDAAAGNEGSVEDAKAAALTAWDDLTANRDTRLAERDAAAETAARLAKRLEEAEAISAADRRAAAAGYADAKAAEGREKAIRLSLAGVARTLDAFAGMEDEEGRRHAAAWTRRIAANARSALAATPSPSEDATAPARVPVEVTRRTDDEGTVSFDAPGFTTVRPCRHCGVLISGGPTACLPCANRAARPAPPAPDPTTTTKEE